jgi:hypothetical protein
LSCDLGLAWNSITEETIIPWFVGPSHQYIDEQAYKSLEKDPAFSAISDKFPKLDQILANEGVSVRGNLSKPQISGSGPDNPLNSKYSYHVYNPRNQQGNAPGLAALYYDSLENGLVDGGNISRDAAYLAHYVADVCCPVHVNGMNSSDALKLPRNGILPLGKDIVGYCLPTGNTGMGCPEYPLSHNNTLPPQLQALQQRGSRGMNCTNWTRELHNWIPLNKHLDNEDWFDPWLEDGIASPEIGSTHLWWEYFAWTNFSRPEYLAKGYAPEYVKRIANTTSNNQKALLDESAQIVEYNSSSVLAQAYYRAITDVYTAWRASFSALLPSIYEENDSQTGDRKLTVRIKNLAPEKAENVWCKLEITGAPDACLGGYGGEYYCGDIPSKGEAVIADRWILKNTADCSGKIAASLEVRGNFSKTPDSGRAYIIKEISPQEVKDPLPSWNNCPAKKAILNFVANATNKSNPHYVVPEERIATFDNDGTLWCEKPDYVQFLFMIDRVGDLAPQHPEWKTEEPFSSILSGKRLSSRNFSLDESLAIALATCSNMTVDHYTVLVRDWLNSTKHPRFGRPYSGCTYRPMLELLNYLRANGFKIYIVTGGGVDFVRAFSDSVYGIPPAQVIGSSPRYQFADHNRNSSILKLPEIWSIGEAQGKPINIQLFIGHRPVFAYGNSDGDIQMLQFATGGDQQGMGILNHHDDSGREYAYDRESLVGKLDRGLEMAQEWDWQVVSMKNDWKEVF